MYRATKQRGYKMLIDIKTVTQMFNNYNDSVQSRPNLYKCRDGAINITLPKDLCWVWSNRAAGDSGGGKARPVGIRLLPGRVAELYGDQDFALEWIFHSVENLAEFITSSDCDGAEHLQNKLLKKADAVIGNHQSVSQQKTEMELLKLAIEKRDNDLARMVLEGRVDEFRKKVA
jgi:hypothetical protein